MRDTGERDASFQLLVQKCWLINSEMRAKDDCSVFSLYPQLFGLASTYLSLALNIEQFPVNACCNLLTKTLNL
jgi:hypothetical protein